MTSEDFFGEITRQFNANLPFVVYRKPNETAVKALLQNDTKLHVTKDYSETGFVFAPFNNEKPSVLIPAGQSYALECLIPTNVFGEALAETDSGIQDRKDGHNTQTNTIVETLETDSNEHRLAHINLVTKGIEAIKNSSLKKVVLSRYETIEFLEKNSIDIFKRLLNTYSTAFVYCWYHPEVGLWLGATPETLLKVEGNRFETMSLAGTQNYQGTLDVEWQPKELDEQQIVTETIVNNLEKKIDRLNVSETRTVRAGNLLHLQTKVSGILNPQNVTLRSILQQLHPTPAVCGFPKTQAKQFILENERYDREYYTGFLGELNLKQIRSRNTNRRNVENSAYASVKTVSNLFVNLRCMQLKKQSALVYVGGGITKGSNSENEWKETLNKAQTIKNVLVN